MMIEINDLQVSYNQPVLRGVTLKLLNSSIHGLLGKNGAGKTTLFKTIYGLIKPDAGKIKMEVSGNRKSQISLLEAEPYFYPYMTGGEYLDLLHESKDKIQFWNEIFSLPLNQFARDYSTGMKKKLAFMAVLLQDKPIWLLDEPFNGVDFETNEKMSKILSTAAQNKTILISSHILDKLTGICDRISVLDAGLIDKTLAKGSFDELSKMLRQEIDQSLQTKMDQYSEGFN